MDIKTKLRKWDYTLQEIAKFSGNSVHTVRDHKQQGFLHPQSLLNVAEYIHSFRVINKMRLGGDIYTED